MREWNLEKYIVQIVKKFLDVIILNSILKSKIEELLKTTHITHVRNGHEVNIRKFVKD